MYAKRNPIPAKFPSAVTVAGVRYDWTGKRGTHRATGLASAEYADDSDSRVWRRADGVVTPD